MVSVVCEAEYAIKRAVLVRREAESAAARRVRPSPSLAWYSGPYMQSNASPAPATTADTSFTQPVGVRRKLSEQQVQILQTPQTGRPGW